MESNKEKLTNCFENEIYELPDFYEHIIGSDPKEKGVKNIFVSKIQDNDHYAYVIFKVDTYCRGVKSVEMGCNLTESEYQNRKTEYLNTISKNEPHNLAYLHNLIYGAYDFAEQYGCKAHKDFGIAENILNTDLIDDGIDQIEFGKNGIPHYIARKGENINLILNQLIRRLGEGNFGFEVEK